MKMPFGKYEGRLISKLPKWYLKWLRKHLELFGELKTAVDCALAGEPEPETLRSLTKRFTKKAEEWAAEANSLSAINGGKTVCSSMSSNSKEGDDDM